MGSKKLHEPLIPKHCKPYIKRIEVNKRSDIAYDITYHEYKRLDYMPEKERKYYEELGK